MRKSVKGLLVAVALLGCVALTQGCNLTSVLACAGGDVLACAAVAVDAATPAPAQ
jgi:hypothetical protein